MTAKVEKPVLGEVVAPIGPEAEKRADKIEAILTGPIKEASADPTIGGLSALPSEVKKSIRAISVAAANDPVVVSAMGAESPAQSPITWLAVGSAFLAAKDILQTVLVALPFDFLTFPWEALVTDIGAFGLAGGLLFARWRPGLKPFFGNEGK